jgi:hypothetical protein
MPLSIVYLNSWPGVGEHTVAKEVEKQMRGTVPVSVSLLYFEASSTEMTPGKSAKVIMKHVRFVTREQWEDASG